ncbi:DUF4118 domain-containing protein [Streptomyces sp. NPDC059874]|uniref:DUF4118 domain-containing protein n=1 Tax=Streptomyces sp. NPDC059874 TaxID=3346983 RepID=UPI003653D603
MSGYSFRLHERTALAAGLGIPFLAALALVPFRTYLSATNEALIMVVAVVAVAAPGTRAAGAVAALSAAAWFDFFLTRPYRQFPSRPSVPAGSRRSWSWTPPICRVSREPPA